MYGEMIYSTGIEQAEQQTVTFITPQTIMQFFSNIYNNKDSSVMFKPEFCPFIHPACKAHHILAEAITQEEHSVLADVGYQSRGRASVEAADSHLSEGGYEAVDEAAVHAGEGLHLHLCGVERLTTQHAGCAT